MTHLVMMSWRKGLQTVSLIEAVKQYSTGSLARAKADVDRFLTGEPTTLEFPTEAARDEFKLKAEQYGVVFK
jgi:hypothetical protein